MTTGPRPSEIIGYRRSSLLPGVEVLDADHSPREWRAIGAGYAVTVLRTWRGDVQYQGRKHSVRPGIAFCNHPDEALVATPEGGEPGSFNVLVIVPELFKEWLAEAPRPGLRPHWAAITKPISAQLHDQVQQFLASFQPGTSALQLQSEMLQVSEGLVRELVSGAGNATLSDGPPIRGTARMRECLNEPTLDVDLAFLAREAGLSRFQALRAFKRRYGLPPHAYQLCVRIQLARRLLLEGQAPADVAASCGFVDQSHLNRHFKRLVGVTPMQYVQSHDGGKGRSSGTFRTHPVVAEGRIVTRSDR